MLVSKKILIQNVLAIFFKKTLLLFFQKFWTCKLFLKNLVGLFYLKSLLGFLVMILAKFLKTCLFFENFWTRNLLRILLNFLLKILIFLTKLVFVKTCWALLEWSCHVFWKFDKNLVGFSYEDLGKFSKNLSVFWKFLNLKLVENLVKFSLENFDILIKICICENMLGILGMILSCL